MNDQTAKLVIRLEGATGTIVTINGNRLQPGEESVLHLQPGKAPTVSIESDERWVQLQKDNASEIERQGRTVDAGAQGEADAKPRAGMTLQQGLDAAERTAPATAETGRTTAGDARPIETAASSNDTVVENVPGTTRTRTTRSAPSST